MDLDNETLHKFTIKHRTNENTKVEYYTAIDAELSTDEAIAIIPCAAVSTVARSPTGNPLASVRATGCPYPFGGGSEGGWGGWGEGGGEDEGAGGGDSGEGEVEVAREGATADVVRADSLSIPSASPPPSPPPSPLPHRRLRRRLHHTRRLFHHLHPPLPARLAFSTLALCSSTALATPSLPPATKDARCIYGSQCHPFARCRREIVMTIHPKPPTDQAPGSAPLAKGRRIAFQFESFDVTDEVADSSFHWGLDGGLGDSVFNETVCASTLAYTEGTVNEDGGEEAGVVPHEAAIRGSSPFVPQVRLAATAQAVPTALVT